ncbi:MAG: LysR family transcriptional regulator substrate-binding protein [Enterocloster bolteae]
MRPTGGNLSDIKGFLHRTAFHRSIPYARQGHSLAPEILPTYQSQFPGIELHLAEGNSSQLASDLLHGNIDLMIDLLPLQGKCGNSSHL